MNKINYLTIRIFDFTFAFLLIIVLMPLIVAAILMSALFIGFPPIYISKRRCKNGALFNHIKIKSMLPGREIGRIFFEQYRLNWCGKFLRGSHLDELTELFHILSGKMSFVGPRPLTPKVLEGLDTGLRETVPPGWTCTAQILLLKKGKLNKHVQIRLDNQYARKRSLLYNLKIITATFKYFFIGKKLDLRTDSTPDRIKFKEQNFL